jgi:excisionase family DNA binding protein
MKKLPQRPLLKASEVADYWGISTASIYRWISEGKMAAIKRVGTVRIPYEAAKKGIRADDE